MTAAGAAANRVSTDELTALAGEIAALARAGMPLEAGLSSLKSDLPRRLGNATSEVAARLERGESLTQALATIHSPGSPLLLAVVEVGLRSGRLPAAVEQLTQVTQMRAELRKQSLLALIYPIVVVAIACAVVVLFAMAVLPRMAEAFGSLRVPIDSISASLLRADSIKPAGWLGIAAAVILLAALLLWGIPALQSWVWRRPGARSWRVPVYGRLFAETQTSYFAAILALLVDHGMPLADALALAGRATGNRALTHQTHAAAERLRRGETLSSATSALTCLPVPFVWTMIAAESQGQLAGTLRRTSQTYRQRALWRADAVRTLLPVAAVVFIAGAATAMCALLLFWPWAAILRGLSDHALR